MYTHIILISKSSIFHCSESVWKVIQISQRANVMFTYISKKNNVNIKVYICLHLLLLFAYNYVTYCKRVSF